MAYGSAFGFSGYDPVMSFVEGSVNSYFDRKAEERAYERQKKLMAYQYSYAKRYAENGPSWQVTGLRNAGLNPVLAATGGSFGGVSSPSVPSSSSHRTPSSGSSGHYDPLTLENFKLLKKQNESLRLDNDLKDDTVKTVKAENEVKRLKAEAEASLLRPVNSDPLEGDGKSVGVLLPSKAFKALQKGISDDFDLRSERYIRETTEAVMKYGVDVLKLLPFTRRKEILKKIILDKKPNGPNSVPAAITATRNGPSAEPVFQYD